MKSNNDSAMENVSKQTDRNGKSGRMKGGRGREKETGAGEMGNEKGSQHNIQSIDKFPEILLSFDAIMNVCMCVCVG